MVDAWFSLQAGMMMLTSKEAVLSMDRSGRGVFGFLGTRYHNTAFLIKAHALIKWCVHVRSMLQNMSA